MWKIKINNELIEEHHSFIDANKRFGEWFAFASHGDMVSLHYPDGRTYRAKRRDVGLQG